MIGKDAKAYMDKGDLVPDQVIIEIIAERIDSHEAEDGFILDGFPRTVGQAEALSEKLEELRTRLTAAILISVPDEEVVRRLGGRRTCSNGHIFHVEFDPPEEEGVCDVCGEELRVRDDDKPEVIKHRLKQYKEKTAPLIDWYDERGLLERVDGCKAARRRLRGHPRAHGDPAHGGRGLSRARQCSNGVPAESSSRRPPRSRRWRRPATSTRGASRC